MRIGIVQMRLSSEVNKNVLGVLHRIRYARRSKLDLLCFPECALSGYIVNHHKIRWREIKDGIEQLQQTSNSYDISVPSEPFSR